MRFNGKAMMERNIFHRTLCFAGLAGVLSGCAMAAAEPSPPAQGRALADRLCSQCHAVELVDASQHPEAPPLRDLFKRYAVEDLRRAFANGVHVGHSDMPTFRLGEGDVDRLLIYLQTLNPCAQPASDRAAMERCFAPL